MKDRVPGAPGQYNAVIQEAEIQKMQTGQQFVITLTRDDQPVVEGTPYSKEAVLPDDLAESLCPGVEDPTPADALRALKTGLSALMPIGYTFEWTPTEGGPDLSTAEKVAEYYGFGTWEAYGAGRFTLGVSDQYSAGSVGGEETHTLTVNEMPTHSHTLIPLIRGDSASEYTTSQYTTILTADNLVAPNQTVNAHATVFAGYSMANGGNQPHNNMPPYVVVYRWRRIA